MVRAAYAFAASFVLFSLYGAFLFGFRHDPAAPAVNILWNLGLYAVFALPHLLMTRGWFKRAAWGRAEGHPTERRFYVGVTAVTWLFVIVAHRPVPGFAVDLPAWVAFIGIVLFLMCFRQFFDGITTEAMEGLLGVPAAQGAYSHGPETPLFTEGSYARIRHPMYRAFTLAALSSVLVHPHVGQLFWALVISGTFIAFIPVEERQLLDARGEDYRAYQRQTPWRLVPGVW